MLFKETIGACGRVFAVCLLTLVLLQVSGRAQGGTRVEDVIWQQSTPRMTISSPSPGNGSALTKSTGTDAWDLDDAASAQVMRADGSFSFKVPVTTKALMVGVAPRNADHTYASIPWVIQLTVSGTFQVREGAAIPYSGTYSANDVFKIGRTGTTIRYYRNGVEFFASARKSIGSLVLDTNFKSIGGSITGCRFEEAESDEQDVNLGPPSGTGIYPALIMMEDDGTAFTHSTTTRWEGCVSTKMIRGDGYLKFRFGLTTKHSAIGLSEKEESANVSSVDYGFEALAGTNATTGTYRILTPTNRTGTTSTYKAADSFMVKRVGGQILFFQNDIQVGSATAPSTPLLVDLKFETASASVVDCRYAGVSGARFVYWDAISGGGYIWQNAGTAIVSGRSSVTKKSGVDNTWDAGARAATSIYRAGFVSFRFDQLDKESEIGFYSANQPASTAIVYGFRALGNGQVQPVRDGVLQSTPVGFTVNDTFTVRRRGGEIFYEKNGSALYSHPLSAAAETAPLGLFASLADLGASISNCEYYGAAETLRWREARGSGASAGYSDGSYLGKSSNANAWDADAVSTLPLYGDGFLEFGALTDRNQAIGFVEQNNDRNVPTGMHGFQYIIHIAGLQTYIFSSAGDSDYFTNGSDNFRVERRNGTMYYYRGGVQLPRSTPGVIGRLFVDSAMQTPGAYFSGVRFYAAPPDSDDDGMIDSWEYQWFGALTSESQSGGAGYENDFDKDGASNLVEFQQGTDPLTYTFFGTPTLTIINGNNQSGPAAAFYPTPLQVRVTNSVGTLLKNAPITFSVTSGAGKIARTTGDTLVTSLPLQTNEQGIAEVAYYSSIDAGTTTIAAVSGTAPNTAQVFFNEYTPVGLPDVQITASVPAVMEGNASPAKFRIERPNRTDGDLTVTYNILPSSTAATGIDFDGAPFTGSVVIPNGSSFVELPVIALSDSLQEADETINIGLTAGRYKYAGGVASVLIYNYSQSTVSVTWVSHASENGAASTAGMFRVRREGTVGALAQPLDVTYYLGGTATPGLDYNAPDGVFSFEPNEQEVHIQIPVIADQKAEGAFETVILALFPSSAYLIGTESATLNIFEPATVLAPVFSPTPNPYMRTEIITITPPNAGATIRYTTDGSEPTASSPAFAAGKRIRITPTTVIKARAYKDGLESTVSVAQYPGSYTLGAGSRSSFFDLGLDAPKAWGSTVGYGHLGVGDIQLRTLPTSVVNASNLMAMSSNEFHTIVVQNNGIALGSGRNDYGQLGSAGGSTTSFRQCAVITNASRAAAGDFHTLVLTHSGDVYAFGLNSNYQLGDNTQTTRTVPQLVPGARAAGTALIGVAAGSLHSLALRDDGVVVGWGVNFQGQLGLAPGTYGQYGTPQPIPSSHFLGRKIVAIAAWDDASMALDEFGTVWEWGILAGRGTFTVPQQSSLTNAVQIACGTSHRAALVADGSVWVVGLNDLGQRGYGRQNAPGGNDTALASQVTNFGPVLQIAAGAYHTLAVNDIGELFGWGNNSDAQIYPSQPVVGFPIKIVRPVDTDGDGLPDWQETRGLGSNTGEKDSNGDGLNDLISLQLGIDPMSLDSDGDGISNVQENAWGTDPLSRDSDGDHVIDSLDAFPLDSTRWKKTEPSAVALDISLDEPINADELP